MCSNRITAAQVDPSPIEPLITVPDVAAVLKVPKSWVYAACAAGTLPHRRVGKYVRFFASEIESWLNSKSA